MYSVLVGASFTGKDLSGSSRALLLGPKWSFFWWGTCTRRLDYQSDDMKVMLTFMLETDRERVCERERAALLRVCSTDGGSPKSASCHALD